MLLAHFDMALGALPVDIAKLRSLVRAFSSGCTALVSDGRTDTDCALSDAFDIHQ